MKKETKTKEDAKKVKKILGRVILPPNKVEKDKKKFSRNSKHKKIIENEEFSD